MGKSVHPVKEIQGALEYAEAQGWRVLKCGGSAHAWGRMYCPFNNMACRCGEFCICSIWSTPRSPGNHARNLKRIIDHCVMRLVPNRPDAQKHQE